MTFGQLSKFTSAMYKSLTPEEKARWEEAAQQDKARYETEMAGYQPPPGFDQTGQLLDTGGILTVNGIRKKAKKVKDPNAPKRARGSYVFFTLDARPKLVAESPEMKFTEMGHVMGERWRALLPEERRRYEDLATADKRRFNEEMAKYNAEKVKERTEAPAPYAHPQYKEAQVSVTPASPGAAALHATTHTLTPGTRFLRCRRPTPSSTTPSKSRSVSPGVPTVPACLPLACPSRRVLTPARPSLLPRTAAAAQYDSQSAAAYAQYYAQTGYPPPPAGPPAAEGKSHHV